jgi:hypothetical protein
LALSLVPPPSPIHPPQGRDAQPSKRYLTLIREGAADYGLSEDYRAWLEGLQHYEATSPGQKLGVWIFRLVAFVGIFPVFAGGCAHECLACAFCCALG